MWDGPHNGEQERPEGNVNKLPCTNFKIREAWSMGWEVGFSVCVEGLDSSDCEWATDVGQVVQWLPNMHSKP